MQEGIIDIKNQLEIPYKYKTEGAMFQNHSQWYQEGECSSKYFLGLEKNHSAYKTMNSTYLQNCQVTWEQPLILNGLHKFYSKLYTSEKQIKFDCMNENDPKLSAEQRKNLDAPITFEELDLSVRGRAKSKMPGCGGLPVKVYKLYCRLLGQPHLQAINFAYENDQLHSSTHRSLLSLIPKSSSMDFNYITQWRPLCLLNCDYKILAKVLAIHMKGVLPNLISEDQTVFMKGRCISHNI